MKTSRDLSPMRKEAWAEVLLQVVEEHGKRDDKGVVIHRSQLETLGNERVEALRASLLVLTMAELSGLMDWPEFDKEIERRWQAFQDRLVERFELRRANIRRHQKGTDDA